jgi:hypothetical protein
MLPAIRSSIASSMVMRRSGELRFRAGPDKEQDEGEQWAGGHVVIGILIGAAGRIGLLPSFDVPGRRM